jgi:uncharacterized protein (TIGR03792 family)
MVIEMLRVTCPPEKRAAFIQRDAEVWTRGLMRHPGFLGKEVWTNPATPSEIILVMRWESLAHWKSFPQEWSRELDAQMGDLLMPLRCEAYEVAVPHPLFAPKGD